MWVGFIQPIEELNKSKKGGEGRIHPLCLTVELGHQPSAFRYGLTLLASFSLRPLDSDKNLHHQFWFSGLWAQIRTISLTFLSFQLAEGRLWGFIIISQFLIINLLIYIYLSPIGPAIWGTLINTISVLPAWCPCCSEDSGKN